MGLIAGKMEERGIATVVLSCLEEVSEKVGPPRRLSLPFPLGYPLGEPERPDLQREILLRALALVEGPGPPPVAEEL